jgi:hypothetical protein
MKSIHVGFMKPSVHSSSVTVTNPVCSVQRSTSRITGTSVKIVEYLRCTRGIAVSEMINQVCSRSPRSRYAVGSLSTTLFFFVFSHFRKTDTPPAAHTHCDNQLLIPCGLTLLDRTLTTSCGNSAPRAGTLRRGERNCRRRQFMSLHRSR